MSLWTGSPSYQQPWKAQRGKGLQEFQCFFQECQCLPFSENPYSPSEPPQIPLWDLQLQSTCPPQALPFTFAFLCWWGFCPMGQKVPERQVHTSPYSGMLHTCLLNRELAEAQRHETGLEILFWGLLCARCRVQSRLLTGMWPGVRQDLVPAQHVPVSGMQTFS